MAASCSLSDSLSLCGSPNVRGVSRCSPSRSSLCHEDNSVVLVCTTTAESSRSLLVQKQKRPTGSTTKNKFSTLDRKNREHRGQEKFVFSNDARSTNDGGSLRIAFVSVTAVRTHQLLWAASRSLLNLFCLCDFCPCAARKVCLIHHSKEPQSLCKGISRVSCVCEITGQRNSEISIFDPFGPFFAFGLGKPRGSHTHAQGRRPSASHPEGNV